ncbi:MAG: hypothetical protein GX879_07030 [Bacteroidales bacterium]|nr:hypothetical protein [Bacteroidales bacterium]
MNYKYIILALIVLGLLASCNIDDNTTDFNTNYDENYFPLKIGLTKTYEISEITIDKPINLYDTVQYILQEQIIEDYIDNSGNQSFIIERSIYNNNSDKFEVLNRYTVQLYDNIAFSVEDNIRFVKLRFPMYNGKKWNTNMFNIFEESTSEIERLNMSFEINNTVFDSTLIVVQQADSSLIHKNYSREIYSKNIGLILKQKTNIESQEVIPNISVDQRISTGTIFEQKLISYNYEAEEITNNKNLILANFSLAQKTKH